MLKASKKGNFRKLIAGFFDGPMKWYDYAVLLALMAFMFFSYQMRDLYHTAGCSYGYLNGHILDFYDYVNQVGLAEDGTGLGASYLPTVYVVFAIWNIPMRILGLVKEPTFFIGYVPVMWAKILPCLVYFVGAYYVYKIALELGMGERKAKFTTYAYVTVPMALFGQFILGQYESFVVLTVLLGVYMWLKKKNFWFVFWFAVGMTFKYTVLIFFIPLLLLREKNIWKILLSMVGVVALMLLEVLIYYHSPAFKTYCFGFGNSDADSPMNVLFAMNYFTGNFFTNVKYLVYVTVVVFALIAAFSYFKNTKDEAEEKRYAMYILCLAFAGLFCFTKWHAHYLMLAIPFWTMTQMMHKNTKIWFVLDLIFMVLFSMYNVIFFRFFHDEALIQNGILRVLLPYGLVGNGLNMQEMLGFLGGDLVLTLLTALIAVYAVFKHPKYMKEDMSEFDEKDINWLRARTVLGLMSFIVPSLLSVFMTIKPPKNSYMEDVWQSDRLTLTEEDHTVVSQSFIANGDTVSKLKFRVLTNEKNVDSVLTVVISKDENGTEPLYEKRLKMVDYYDGERVILKPGIDITEGETYYVVFTAKGSTEEGETELMTSVVNNALPNLLVNGEEKNYHLVMDVMN